VTASRRTAARWSIEKSEIEKVRKDLADQQRILEEDLFSRVHSLLVGKVAAGARAS